MKGKAVLKGTVAAVLLVLSMAVPAAKALAGATLDAVKARGELVCGVHTGLYGFGAPDDKGVWRGIDVDVCRAVAAAVFGDDKKVKYVPLSAQARLTALQSGEIDLLSRNTTWTLTRDTANGLNFTGVNYYDGQGFMVAKKLGVTSAKELSGATVCVQTGTTTELNLADYFRANKMDLKPVTIEKYEEVTGAFVAGRCDAHHLGRLAARRHPRQRYAQPRRLRHPAGADLEGAAGPVGAPGRRPVVRHRQVGAVRDARRRGARPDRRQRRSVH